MGDLQVVTRFLRRHRTRVVFSRIANAICAVAGAFFLGWSLLALVFAALPWIGLPILWDISVVVMLITCIGLVVRHAILRPPTLREIALRLEKTRQDRHQWLLLALELGAQRPAVSPSLVGLVVERAVNSLEGYPSRLGPLLNPGRVRLVVAGAAAFTLCATFPRPRLFAYWDVPLRIARQISVSVQPGTIAVPRNARCVLRCVPSQHLFPSARLLIEELGTTARSRHLLRPDTTGAFSFIADSVALSFAYTFSLGNKLFGPETVTVVAPPRLNILQIALEPPRYTGRRPVELAEGKGGIAAYAGTRASFRLGSHFPLRRALFMPERGDTVELRVEGKTATGTVPLRRSGRYTFGFVDTLAQQNDSLPSFYIDILPDLLPSVRILRPGMNKDLSAAQLETLWIEGVDDLGIRLLACKYRKNTDPLDSVSTWDLSPSRATDAVIRTQVIWSLAELSLYPGDTVYYWAFVQDNKPLGAPQTSSSDTFWFRVPSFKEIHERIAEKESGAEQTLKAVREYQNTMKQQLEQLIRSAKGKEKLSWEEKKIVEDLGENLRAQVDSLSDAVESLKQAVEQMQEQGALSREIVDKMNDVREAIKELIEEYGDSLLFEPPKDGESLSWEDMKSAVEKMKNLLPDLQEHLDNTLRYLETLRKDQVLANLAARAGKLAERQLQQTSGRNADSLEQQQDISDDVEDLLKDINSLALDSGQRVLDPEDLPSMEGLEALQKAMRDRLAQNARPSQSQMAQMSGALQSLSQDLMGMLSTAMMAQMMKDRDMLLRLARDVLDMAKWQQNVAGSQKQGSNRHLSAANQQALMEALRKSMEKLDSLLAVPPSMLKSIMANAEKALAEMGRSLASMPGGMAPGPGGRAGQQLNSLASSLLSSAEALGRQCQGACPSGMGGGLLPGLRKLSGKQAAINAATADLLRQMLQSGNSEGGMSMGQSSPRAAEAAQRAQQQIAEELKRLAEQYGKNAGGGTEKKMKELEEEAARLANMLKDPKPQVRDRQERYLVRLLQTTLSMHKQDEGKEERTSSSATTIFSDNEIQQTGKNYSDADTFYRIRTRAMEGNFPQTYRQAVQTYFDSLGVLFLKD